MHELPISDRSQSLTGPIVSVHTLLLRAWCCRCARTRVAWMNGFLSRANDPSIQEIRVLSSAVVANVRTALPQIGGGGIICQHVASVCVVKVV